MKKRRKTSSGIGIPTGTTRTHKRSVLADLSNNMLDKIKEEPDTTSEKSTVNSSSDKPKIHINKILVRTPAIGIEQDNDISGADKEAANETKGVGDSRESVTKPEMPARAGSFDREVTFSVRSEMSDHTTMRANSQLIRRPKSCRRFTKADLEQFLPRKSFFSSHDKLLIEAGQQVDTHKERKKPDWRSILRMHTMDELYPPVPKDEADDDNVCAKESDSESEDELFSIEKTDTLMSKEGHKTRSRSSKSAANPEREKCKPLYDYLKYIHDNPEEYVSQTKFTAKNLEHKHPNNLVRLGRAFRRGSNIRNNIYLHAINGLKSGLNSGGPQLQKSSTGSTGQQKSSGPDQVAGGSGGQEEAEIVKLKTKTETWLKGLTTHQFLKARETALREVGEEDVNYTKWWLAFRSCQYLRLPRHVVTSVTVTDI